MRTLIIHNSKSGFGSDAIFQFERALACEGDEVTVRLLAKDFDNSAVVEGAEDFDLVVLSGGDGTVANLLYELRGLRTPICVFPSGTANLLCANIGNSLEPTALARACRMGHTTPVDLGEITWEDAEGASNTRGFTIMSGIGFDAQIMREALPNKASLGEAAYFSAAIANPKPTVGHFTIDIDGETLERDGISCLVANNAMIQGEIQVVPGCRMDDGLLDVIVLEAPDVAHLITPIVFGLVDHEGDSMGRPHIEGFRGKSIRVECSEPMPLEYDGEPVPGGISAYEAHALPGSINLIVDETSPYFRHEEESDEPLFGNVDVIPYPEAL